MPYLIDKVYVEYDFKNYTLLEFYPYLRMLIYKIEDGSLDLFQPMAPSPVDVLPKMTELASLAGRISLYDSYYTNKSVPPEQKKRSKELLNEIVPILYDWGVQISLKGDGKNFMDFYDAGFPCLFKKDIHKPTLPADVSSKYKKEKSKDITFYCKKHPGLLIFFYWEISEDNGVTWRLFKKTRLPECTFSRLKKGVTYMVRMCLENGRGKSGYKDAGTVEG